uniref:phosphoglycerate kinase n=1 Tax=Jeotgalibaca porci TaxID=1868793 RepID=UPI00359F771F
MTKKVVTDLAVAGKKVLVRADFNVPMKDGEITNDNRIVQAMPTIEYLIENNAKVKTKKMAAEIVRYLEAQDCICHRGAGYVDPKSVPERVE